MKFLKSLPFRLLMGIVLGFVLGLFLPLGAMKAVVTVQYVLNQMITFSVPLIIIGFIAPSITKLGSSATRMLSVALLLAYVSSALAATLSMTAGYLLIPHLAIHNTGLGKLQTMMNDVLKTGSLFASETGVRELPDPVFQLDIPQIMPVMSALVLSVLLGLATVWTKAKTIERILDEFQGIVLRIVEKVIIPILPFFILVTFCSLSWEGTITTQLPVFLVVILIVLAGHFIWLGVLYLTGSAYAKRSGLEVVRHYGMPYITAIGTMSSAATLSVALQSAHKSKNLRSDVIDFALPLFSNTHLCGSVLTEVFFVMTISQVLYGHLPDIGSMILFVLLLGIFAIGAPGVPGGTVMASLGLVTGILGFDAGGTALLLAVFALQDSFGTACNIVGDGALALFLTGYADRHGMGEVSEAAPTGD